MSLHRFDVSLRVTTFHTMAQASFSIGGVRVQVSGESEPDVALFAPLEPFRIGGTDFDISIQVQWVSGLAPCDWRKAFDSGTTWKLYEVDSRFEFEFNSPNRSPHIYERLLVDKQFRNATLQMSHEYFIDYPGIPKPLGYPLDELLIMHRLTQEKAIELHGTGIVRANGEANLFVGHSGAGKSTTTRLWTDVEDVEVLSDDRIIVRRDEDCLPAHRKTESSEKKVGILRLHEQSASPIAHSAQNDNASGASCKSKYPMRMYGTPWHGEAMFASPNSAPLTRIFVLEHGHGNVITPLTPSQAVAELFARSFVPFHRHEYVDSALSFLEELANSVPVYRYSFEPDLRAVEKVRQFRD